VTHTRLPRYVRGRLGMIESLHGCHVFPDTNGGPSLGRAQQVDGVCGTTTSKPCSIAADRPNALRASRRAFASVTTFGAHSTRGKIRNGSILCGSTRAICGGPTQTETLAYRWMHGSHIWSRLSKPPKAYCASLRTHLCRKG
jgi:hypothetical protein